MPRRILAALFNGLTLGVIHSAIFAPTAEATPPRIVSIVPSPAGGIVDQVGLAEVAITFSEPVDVGDQPVFAWGVVGGELPLQAAYDATFNRLTITFDPPVKDDRVTLTVLPTVEGSTGLSLDGEIASPMVPSLPSGDGVPGGIATFRFDVLQGDADGDGQTNLFDLGVVLDALGACSGDPGFSVLADVNNDACVNAIDVQIVMAGQGGVLPPLDGIAPTIVATGRQAGAPLTADLDTLTVTFSEPLTALSVLSGAVVLRALDETVWSPISTSLSADGSTIACHFDPPVSSCGNYTVSISNAFSDPSGELVVATSPAPTFFGSTPPPTPLLNDYPSATTAGGVTISGTIPSLPGFAAAAEIRIQGQQQVVIVPATTTFSAVVPLLANEVNNLFVSAISPCGVAGAPVVATVTRDLTPPNLSIFFPANGSTTFEEHVNVGGAVGDTLSGFEGLTVMVNGRRAIVDIGLGQNGTWVCPDVALEAAGVPTLISVVASDVLGNSETKSITVTRQAPPRNAGFIEVLSGDDQTGEVNTILGSPILVKIWKSEGKPWPNKLVDFKVTQNDGRLSGKGFGSDTMLYQALTDASGVALATWRLGGTAGCGNNRVVATANGVAGQALFSATGLPAIPDQINIGAGNNQRVEVGAPTPQELSAWVSDSCNPVAGVPVTFTVTAGDGLVNGKPQVTIPSDPTGHAEVDFTAGSTSGTNRVEANFAGNKTSPAVFTTYGIARDLAKPTSFRGLVLDNASRPVGHVKITLQFADTLVGPVFTNEQGQFELVGFEQSGAVHVIVEGFLANTLNGEPIPGGIKFPALGYDASVVPNADNTLGTPILLPPMMPENTVTWDGQSDITLTCAGIEGLKFTVKANSMTLFNGSTPTTGAPVTLSLNQVHHDDVPMPMPNGVAPAFAWTFQPPEATFDPPVEIEYPNMSVLPPGATAYFLSFNHDLGAFEIVAPGTVSADGSVIRTEEGTGLTLSGWGCNCPPYAVTADCCNATPTVCFMCEKGSLVPKPNGTPCDDGDPCTMNDVCQAGVCKGTPVGPPGGPMSVPLTTNGWGPVLSSDSAFGNHAKSLSITVDGAIYLDESAAVYRYQLTSANHDGVIEISTTKYTEPVPSLIGDCPPTTPGTVCYCTIVNSLQMYVPCGTGPYQPVAATIAHEEYHRDHDYPSFIAPLWQEAIAKIGALAVGCDKSPAEAKALLQMQAAAIAAQARQKMFQSQPYKDFKMTHNSCKSSCMCTQGAYQAGDVVVQAKIAEILAIASASQFMMPCPPQPKPPIIPGPSEPGLDVLDIVLSLAPSVCAPGGGTNLTVLALLGDGSQVDITNHPRLELDSANPGIAWVAGGATVMCVSPGDVAITASFFGDGDEPWDFPAQDSVQLRVTSEEDPDGDLIPTAWELKFGLMPTDATDAALDNDGDGLGNLDEYLRGTNPTVADTDGDGIGDGAEVKAGTNPTLGIAVNDRWTLTLDSQQIIPNADGSFVFENVNAADLWGANGPGTPPDFVSDTPIRVTGVGVVDGYTRYVSSSFFTLTQGQFAIVPPLTTTNVPPQGPTSIEVTGSASVVPVGSAVALHVTAVLNNGLTEDVTFGRSGTTYRTTSPAIATVGRDGVVSAHQAGTVFITAMNAGATAVKRIDVTSEVIAVTVTGIVRFLDGTPVDDADVTTTFGGQATSSNDGAFLLPLSAPIRASSLVVQAQVDIAGQTFVGSATVGLSGAPGAVDAGDIIVVPVSLTTLYGPAQVAVGEQPVDVLLIDLNGDGWLDLVSANKSSHDVTVAFGGSNGGFDETLFLAMGTAPGQVISGDLNLDGLPDLVVIAQQGVLVRLNQGRGTFGQPDTVSMGTLPSSLVVADLDGDGQLDLAATNPGEDAVTIRLGAGDGVFEPPTVLPFGNEPGGLVATDIDSDSDIDLLVTNFDNDRITLRRNRGGASFGPPVPIVMGDGPTELVVADFNGDGPMDLATSNYWGDDITVRLADDRGGFAASTSLPDGAGPIALIAADLDLDDDIDLASCHAVGGTVGIHWNLGAGVFAPVMLEPAGAEPTSIASGDVDGDGWPDLVVSNAGSATVTLLRGHRGGDFGAGSLIATEDKPVAVASADFDGNGTVDIAVANEHADAVSIHAGDGAGSFTTATILPMGESPAGVVAADVDGNGTVDLLTIHPAIDALILRRKLASGSWGAAESIAMGQGPTSALVADLDGDGLPDLVTANPETDSLTVRPGLAGGDFGPAETIPVGPSGPMGPTGDGPRDVTSGDFDADGDVDLATANEWSKDVSILLNTGSGDFTLDSRGFDVRPTDVRAEDLDGDGLPELIVLCAAADQVHVLYADGGVYSRSVVVPTAGRPSDVVVADVDGDGDRDLLVACGEDGVVALHEASVDGTFKPALTFVTAPDSDSIAVADFDQDGRLDVIATAPTLDRVVLLRQMTVR